MIRFWKKLLFFLFIPLMLCIQGNADAGSSPISIQGGEYDALIKENKVVTAVNEGNSDFANTIKKLFLKDESVGSSGNLMYVNIAIGVIAFLYIVFLGIKMIFNGGDEDKISKYRMEILWIIVGLSIISAAFFIANNILNPTISGALEENNSIIQDFFAMVRSVEGFLRIIVWGISLMMITLSGYNFLVAGNNDETVGKEKAFALNFLLGAGLILLGEVIVRLASRSEGVYFTGDSSVIALNGVDQIVGLINYVLTFFAVACLLMMVIASLYYVISFGDDDKTSRAKKIIINTAIGIVISLSVLVIIRIFLIG